MMKKLFNASLFLALVAAAVLAGVQLFVFTPEAVQEELLRQLKRGFSGQVKLGGARVSWFSSIALHDLSLADASGQESFLVLKNASLSLDLWALCSGRIRFSELALDGLELGLHRMPDGHFTFEPFVAVKHASLHVPRVRWEALLAASGSADAALPDEPKDGIAIHRITIRGARVNYLDALLPVQVHHINGALRLDPDQLEILTLRGRAFDRFPVSVNGLITLPAADHKLEVRLDEVPLKPLLSFLPPLNLLLTIAHEQLEGWIAVVAESHSDPHGMGTSVALKFHDLRWSSRLFASTINAPHADLTMQTKGSGDALKIEGDIAMEAPLVRPRSFTQDIPCQEVRASFESSGAFARLRGYTVKLNHGTLSGSGYASWATRAPDYELGFNLDQVPLPDVGLAGPESSAMARDMRMSVKGRMLPAGVQVTAASANFGASRMYGAANLVPDGVSWMVRDASARVELDAADLAPLLGIGGSVKLAGKLEGAVYPQGPLGQLRGRGKLERTKLTLSPASGGDAVTLALDEVPVELAGTQLVLPEVHGTLLGGQLKAALAFSTQALSPSGARMNFDLTDVDAAALAKALGAPGAVKSGRLQLEGLIGSRVNVGSGAGGPPPAPLPDQRVVGVLASPPITGTTSVSAGPLTTGAAIAPRPLPPEEVPPMPAGPLLSGNVVVRDLVATLPAPKSTPVTLAHATARMMWEADGLSIANISGAGPDGLLTGSLRLEGPGKARGKLVLASRGGEIAIELPAGH